jgi:formate hydrogenlyase subunit 4
MTFNAIVASRLFEYVKLMEMTIVMVLNSVEYEHTFLKVGFMKFKHHNLLTTNLDLAVCIYAQQFYMMQYFPF